MSEVPSSTPSERPQEDVQLPMAGQEVSRVCFDWAITLEFLDGFPETSIRIGGKIRLQVGTEEVEIDPEVSASAGRAVVLVRKRAAAGIALRDGTLRIVFSDGTKIAASPSSPYEAWELSASNGLKLVCLPSGGLAVWDSPWSSPTT